MPWPRVLLESPPPASCQRGICRRPQPQHACLGNPQQQLQGCQLQGIRQRLLLLQAPRPVRRYSGRRPQKDPPAWLV
jgi:hypothetical protein